MDDLELGNMAVNPSPFCFASSSFQVSGEQIHDNFPAELGELVCSHYHGHS